MPPPPGAVAQPAAPDAAQPDRGGGVTLHADAAGPVRLYVGGLAPDVTASELAARFQPFGEVIEVDVRPARRIEDGEHIEGSCRGFGYIELAPKDALSLARCLSLYNGAKWRGSVLRVERAREHYTAKFVRERAAELEDGAAPAAAGAASAAAGTDGAQHVDGADEAGAVEEGGPPPLMLRKRGRKMLTVPLQGTGRKHRHWAPSRATPLSQMQWDGLQAPPSQRREHEAQLAALLEAHRARMEALAAERGAVGTAADDDSAANARGGAAGEGGSLGAGGARGGGGMAAEEAAAVEEEEEVAIEYGRGDWSDFEDDDEAAYGRGGGGPWRWDTRPVGGRGNTKRSVSALEREEVQRQARRAAYEPHAAATRVAQGGAPAHPKKKGAKPGPAPAGAASAGAAARAAAPAAPPHGAGPPPGVVDFMGSDDDEDVAGGEKSGGGGGVGRGGGVQAAVATAPRAAAPDLSRFDSDSDGGGEGHGGAAAAAAPRARGVAAAAPDLSRFDSDSDGGGAGEANGALLPRARGAPPALWQVDGAADFLDDLADVPMRAQQTASAPARSGAAASLWQVGGTARWQRSVPAVQPHMPAVRRGSAAPALWQVDGAADVEHSSEDSGGGSSGGSEDSGSGASTSSGSSGSDDAGSQVEGSEPGSDDGGDSDGGSGGDAGGAAAVPAHGAGEGGELSDSDEDEGRVASARDGGGAVGADGGSASDDDGGAGGAEGGGGDGSVEDAVPPELACLTAGAAFHRTRPLPVIEAEWRVNRTALVADYKRKRRDALKHQQAPARRQKC